MYSSQSNISMQPHHTTTNYVANMQHYQQQQQFHQQTQHLQPQPPITQMQTMAVQQTNQFQQFNNNYSNTTFINNANSTNNISGNSRMVTTAQSAATQDNTKEKCCKLLINLINLATREPKPVEENMRNLIQELVNADIEPEEFCSRLQRLLNANPQPHLIGFLKRSLPLLRQAMFSKELVIDGIKPPPQHIVGGIFMHLPKIQAHIRPIGQNQITSVGQTQFRTISNTRPSGYTTNQPVSNYQIRAPVPHQAYARPPPQTAPMHMNMVQIPRPIGTHISRPVNSPQPSWWTAIPNSVPNTCSNLSSTASIMSTINDVASNSMGSRTSLPIQSLPPKMSTQQQQQSINSSNSLTTKKTALKLIKASEIKTVIKTAPVIISSNASVASLSGVTKFPQSSMTTLQTPNMANKAPAKLSAASASKAVAKKTKEQADKERDEQKMSTSTSATSVASFFQQPSKSMSSYGDDDFNDVAAMGGVNLAEETQRILGCTENIGTQTRSCKDETFLNLPVLQARIRSMVMERGLEEPSEDVAVLISHACQERLKNIVEKLAVIAEHRTDVLKLNSRYEVSKDVRGQIKFLEEIDKAEKKRHENSEREMLLRAAKSRSKIENPEQAKMKARAKEMQRAEMEELRQREANMTALRAIGPRKKIKLDGDGPSSVHAPIRPRIKRINLRDMLFFMEQERETCRSQMLYKAYLK